MKDMISLIKNEVEIYMQEHYFSGHDFSHILRVYNLSKNIGEKEKADMLILEVAALLHDIGRADERKNPTIDHAERSAEIADNILKKVKYPENKAPEVIYAIREHRFRKGVIPKTLEAMILQDADRIDICGAIGIAMTFSYGGAYNSYLYHIDDLFGEHRELDDKKYALDHFFVKLLKLPDSIHTKKGKQIAKERNKFLKLYVDQLKNEIEGTK